MKQQKKTEERKINKKLLCITLGAVAAIFFGVNVWGIFYIGNHKKVVYTKEIPAEFSMLSPSVFMYDQKDMVVNLMPLREYLTKTYESSPNISIYYENLNTGSNISIGKDAEFFPASLLKLPLAMAAMKKIEKGEWKWTNQLVMMAGDRDKLFGEMWKDPVGTKYTIETLIRRVLAESDNTAHYILLRNLEETELVEVYDHLGLEDFFSENGKISAKRFAVILRSLYNATYLTKEDSQRILDILTASKFDDYLEQSMPKGTKYAHKIGFNNEEQVVMDAGIVYYPNRPYLLIVMIKSPDEKGAKEIMRDISKRVSDYVVGYSH